MPLIVATEMVVDVLWGRTHKDLQPLQKALPLLMRGRSAYFMPAGTKSDKALRTVSCPEPGPFQRIYHSRNEAQAFFVLQPK